MKFESRLLQVGDEYQKRASRAVATTAREIGKLAQSNAPVRTGRLKRSMAVEISYLVAYIGFTADYAGFVNYGTRLQSANPFFTMAMLQAQTIFERNLQAELR